MRSSLLSVFAITSTLASPALAWNDVGHELIACMAYQQMKPEARAQAGTLLRKHPQYDLLTEKCPSGFDKDQYVFMRAATWPDLIRSPKNPAHATDHHAGWHFINIPVNGEGGHGREPDLNWSPGSMPENIVQALQKCEADLKDAKLPDADKAKALAWYLHLVGDIHQPLHAGTLFSKDYPQGDKGGNILVVKDGTKVVPLHELWDDILGKHEAVDAVAEQAKRLLARKDLSPDALKRELAPHTFQLWAQESTEIAKVVAYENGKIKGAKPEAKGAMPDDAPGLSKGYHSIAEKTAEKRATLAAYRLSGRLDELLTSKEHGGR